METTRFSLLTDYILFDNNDLPTSLRENDFLLLRLVKNGKKIESVVHFIRDDHFLRLNKPTGPDGLCIPKLDASSFHGLAKLVAMSLGATARRVPTKDEHIAGYKICKTD